MRKFKFRAWNKADPGMIENFVVGADGQPYLDDSGHLTAVHLELMQWTGLKDKNGTDIYEGDIVQYSSDESLMSKWCCGRRAIVKGLPGRFVFQMSPFDRTDFDNINLVREDCSDVVEIIGNVYEHPELLEEE